MQPILEKAIASLYKLPMTAPVVRFLAGIDWRLAPALLVRASLILFTIWLFGAVFCICLRLFHHLRQRMVLIEITPPKDTQVSAISTSGLFTLIAESLQDRSLPGRLLLRQPSCSMEIVSSSQYGVRYLLRTPQNMAPLLTKNLRAYLPGIQVTEAEDYLPDGTKNMRVMRLRLAKRFALPLSDQSELKKHDPLAYLTAAMGQLEEEELLALQIVVRPVSGYGKRREIARVKTLIRYGRFADWIRYTPVQKAVLFFAMLLEGMIRIIMSPLLLIVGELQGFPAKLPERPKELVETPSEKELAGQVKRKLEQPLLDTSVTAMLFTKKERIFQCRRELVSAFASYRHPSGQGLVPEGIISRSLSSKLRTWEYRSRYGFTSYPLSVSELASLYHFPFDTDAQVEDFTRVRSRELPAPLSLKNSKNLDVVFGRSTFGNGTALIGLTDEDRSRHLYLLGQTGSGKSTIVYHMASDDIRRGRGLAVIDPHGDLATDLLGSVPEERTNDLIYLNPFDIKHPIGINLLELMPTSDEDELELEKELVCESVISVFRRVFSKDENADAHRIEYILRNAIHTAFTVPNCTIFTVYDLLNDPNYRKAVIRTIKDRDLLNFWRHEFGQAGNFQVVKMVSGVTAKVGRFLFSPVAKRILEQPRSTINFDEILDSHKILLCNLAEGKIGEDTSRMLGTVVIAKLHQAAMHRARQDFSSRTPFYLFIDEFQNFATSSFTRLLSGGRKFGLRVTVAEQSTSQQDDRNVTNVILANTGTAICFRTASPLDEELMLAQFSPAVEKGDIMNLPRYRFYMKLAATVPEAPFSGETLPMPLGRNLAYLDQLVAASRTNYAVRYERKIESVQTAAIPAKPSKEPLKRTKNAAKASSVPDINVIA